MCAAPPSAGYGYGYARLVRPGGARHPLPSELDWTGGSDEIKLLAQINYFYLYSLPMGKLVALNSASY